MRGLSSFNLLLNLKKKLKKNIILFIQVNKDDCESDPCHNGVCVDEVDGFHCNCENTGYIGTLCDLNENECKRKPNICLNGGICYDTYGSYVCECQANFEGFNCEQLIDQCSANPCENGATCINRKDGVQCVCPHGFFGVYCENGNECGRDCPKGTECISGECCEPDVNGKQCKTLSTADCNCLNGGTCNGNGNSTVCICPEGFEGSICENDIDECIQNPNICVHGICVNQPGTFKCYCEPGKL